MVGQRGTALLMTMILITVIGSIAFGVGRTTLSNLRQVNRLEDSLNAYQAAQAGIEDALLRFRFDKNAEAPRASSCTTISNNPEPTSANDPQKPNIFSRVDISNPIFGACVDVNAASIVAPVSSDIVYDLKMSYKKAPGDHECISIASPPITVETPLPKGCVQLKPGVTAALESDTALEYDVRTISPSSNLHLEAVFASSNPSNPNNALEIISLGTVGSQPDQIINQMLIHRT